MQFPQPPFLSISSRDARLPRPPPFPLWRSEIYNLSSFPLEVDVDMSLRMCDHQRPDTLANMHTSARVIPSCIFAGSRYVKNKYVAFLMSVRI